MKILKVLLFTLISSCAFSQKNYVKGFIILKNQTDTLRGTINDQEWVINPTKINFIDENNNERLFYINELKSFGVIGKENYLVEKTDLDITPFFKGELLKDRNLIIKKDTLLAFLVLLKADYSLLYLTDANRKQHFFYKDGQRVTELINHMFLQEREGKIFEFNNKIYQKQLELLFNECPKKIGTSNTTYGIQPLTDKFIEFSECLGCTYTCYVKKKEDKGIFAFGIMGGVSFESNFFSHQDYFERTYFEAKTTVPTMLVGLSFSFSPKRNLNRNSFVLEAFVNKENIKNKAENYSTSINYLHFVPLFRHQFINQRQAKPFLGIGMNIKYLISYRNEAIISGDRTNLFLVGDAGFKLRNFLFSARINVKPKQNIEDLAVLYKNVAEVVDKVKYTRVNFQINLTYLLYNNVKKPK